MIERINWGKVLCFMSGVYLIMSLNSLVDGSYLMMCWYFFISIVTGVAGAKAHD